ncbi:MAG: tetratricopeptide repeat protein [Planctomycetota bacterium]|nr:tetratricopeptide repeat protein [Planctomycetota bacterium]
MEMKKETGVFLAVAGLLGWSAYGLISDGAVDLRGGASGAAKSYSQAAVPDSGLALPTASRSGTLQRDLFSPPRDTTPLPLLELILPPLEPLPALAPPSAYGPAAKHMGKHLRTRIPTRSAQGLFNASSMEPAPISSGGSEGVTTVSGASDADLTVDERLARIEARKKLYDWVVVANLKFGRIENRERFGLKGSGEAILFLEIDPSTGKERFPGQQAVAYEAERVQEFGFADTPTNRVELGRAAFGSDLRPGDFDGAMRFAGECLELRNETPRALEAAEDLYGMCVRLQPTDVRPHLGLARCHELGFDFQAALDVYAGLTEGDLHTEPEPWARLGDLYARFRMRGPAQQAFDEGLRRSRTDWLVRWLYGRFLLDAGQYDEAYEHLNEAQKREPTGPDLRAERVGIRTDFGRVLMAQGEVQAARDAFERGASADPEADLGPAGVLAASVLLGESEGLEEEAGDGPDASFDLLFARGLAALQAQEDGEAVRSLRQAAAVDPFRGWLCWRSLSWVAEITGHPEEAWTYIEMAHAANPEDTWTLYQRGRLQTQRDEDDEAMSSFRAALDHELDFPDALVAMGALASEGGDPDSAERYFERALSIDPARPVVHARRGLNFLVLGELGKAEAAFGAALTLNPDMASARNGMAWWQYLSGDSGQAQASFAELVDIRRNEAEGDAPSQYAEAQSARIRDHESKEFWRDRFDRVGRVGNGWTYDQGYGAEVRLRDGAVWIEGQLTKESRTRLYRELPADRLLSLEAELTVHPDSRDVTVGIFVARETEGRTGDIRTHAAVELVRHWDGAVRATLTKKGELDAAAQDLYTAQWDVGEPMRVGIEKRGETSSDTTVTLWVDDVPVIENLALPTLGRSSQPLRFGIFVEGRAGRRASVSVDHVGVVRRRL